MTNIFDLDCPIVGFELTGDPVLDGEFLPLQQGLTVLYGLNGAGKSRLLRGIRGALTGVREDVEVGMVVEADPSRLHGRWSAAEERPRPLSGALAQAITVAEGGTVDNQHLRYGDIGASPAERPVDDSRSAEIITSYIERMAGDADPEFTAEVIDSRLFLLMPTGTTTVPSWDAWAVADMTSPAAAAIQAELDALEADFDALSDDDEDAWWDALDEMNEKVLVRALFGGQSEPPFARRRGRMVIPQRYRAYGADELQAQAIRGLELIGDIEFGVDVVDVEADPASSTGSYIAELFTTLWEENPFVDDDLTDLDTIIGRSQGRLTRFHPDRLWHDASEGRDAVAALVESTITRIVGELGALANEELCKFLPDAPHAVLRLHSPALRMVLPPLEWRFDRDLPLGSLSRAEQQWTTHAINQAIHLHRRQLLRTPATRPAIWLMDEPEAALHRAAEAQMAHALAEHASFPGHVVIAATHSPELLDSPESHLVEVQRGAGRWSGQSLVHGLDLSDRNTLSTLGLNPSDLLRWPRIIMLVEGVHDEILLNAFIGDRLRAARVQIIPLHGGSKLAGTVDSQVLFDFTQATVVGLVDNLRVDAVRAAWRAAQEAAVLGDLERAKNLVLDGIPQRTEESGFIRTWLTRALDKGLHGRIEMLSLSARDIVEYLPVDRFVAAATSWDALHDEHKAARSSRANAPKQFKPWLAAAKNADFSADAVGAAADGIDTPKEFLDLASMIEALSTPQPR